MKPFAVLFAASAVALVLLSSFGGAAYPFPTAGLPGYVLEPVHVVDEDGAPTSFRFPTSLLFIGDRLFVVEAGRHGFQAPYDGVPQGRVLELTIDGNVASRRVVQSGLADPVGIAVFGSDIMVSEYNQVRRLGAPADAPFAWGLPAQRPDTTYLPGSDENILEDTLADVGQGGMQDFDTTGTMGLAVLDGRLIATQGSNGRPPDDPGLGERGYGSPLSSSVLALPGGKVSTSHVLGQGCRNCYDLAVAPADSPYAGRVFVTENTDAYRARVQSGSDRTVLGGSTPTDASVADALVELDLESGRFVRVATYRPTGQTGAAVPTGIAFVPESFSADLAGLPAVTILGGNWVNNPATPFRGEVVATVPDTTTGIGVSFTLAQGLDNPIDLTFSPEGALYVVEYLSGKLYRVVPE